MININVKTEINPDEVVWIEGHVNYSKIIFKNQTPIMVAVTLKKIEEILKDYNFYRINRATLINLNYVKLTNGYSQVEIKGNYINASRRRVGAFKKLLITSRSA
jgi:DNA-binding LytR/AlgR family response regulator